MRHWSQCLRFWNIAASALLAAVSAASARPRRIQFYTFSDTIPHPGLCSLAEAAAELGMVLRVIGLSKRPGYILIHSHSPTLKFLMLQEVVEYELSAGRVSPDDLMLFADGHDVLLQRPLSELVAAYERWPGSPFLISGEKNCWPWPHSDPSHGKWDPGMSVDPNTSFKVHDWLQMSATEFCKAIPDKGPYRYPNIGLSMGPVWRYLEVLRRNNRIVLDEDVNDQGAMWLVIIRHAPELNMVIDQNATVFLNMLQYEEGELEREPCGDDWFAASHGEGAQAVGDASAPYMLTGLFLYCHELADLTTEESCREAAQQLGLSWGGSYVGPGDHRNCLYADDGRFTVYFNAAGAAASRLAPSTNYRSVCRQGPDLPRSPGGAWPNAPPRVRLTNETPALVHFNGPAHEDGVWPTCYYAWTREFRATRRGHALFDVDHNFLLSTDEICDYDYYRIHDFHAHPVHAGTLKFLEDLYSMPVDPGLVAHRGISSAIDARKLGREQDLHTDRPLIHKALGGDQSDGQ